MAAQMWQMAGGRTEQHVPWCKTILFMQWHDAASLYLLLNAIRCIWTNFCDVVSIIRGWLLSPKQLQLANLLMKWTFSVFDIDDIDDYMIIWYRWFDAFDTHWSTRFNRTMNDGLDKMCKKIAFTFLASCMKWSIWYRLTLGHFLLPGLLDRPFKKSSNLSKQRP